MSKSIVRIDAIESLILFMRGQRVIVDADLARLYGTSTKRLNEQVRRNRGRFPSDFRFRLTESEKNELVANCDRFRNLKHSGVLPVAFTEFGAIMAANVLNSPRAVRTSVYVVRAFVRMRELVFASNELAARLDVLEQRADNHDQDIRELVETIRRLTEPEMSPSRKIGFRIDQDSEG
jgi:hypothetical protein